MQLSAVWRGSEKRQRAERRSGDDDGNVYLAGVKPGEHMIVYGAVWPTAIFICLTRCQPICQWPVITMPANRGDISFDAS